MQAGAFAAYEHLASPLAVACRKHLAALFGLEWWLRRRFGYL